MLSLENTAAAFQALYGEAPLRLAFAPGRVNLIGEHTDYMGGSALPMAITRGISLALGPAPADVLELSSSLLLGGQAAALPPEALQGALAIARFYLERLSIPGARILVQSDLPPGMGLSSSAAFCVALGSALATISVRSPDLRPSAIARFAQAAEQQALSVKCGLLDQYSSVHGGTLLFDALLLRHIEIEPPPLSARFVVIDSGQQRSLAAGDYNERRGESEQAFRLLRRCLGDEHENFREISVEIALTAALSLDATSQRRLSHLYTEQQRVGEFSRALAAGDCPRMGRVLNESQRSLSLDCEVSTPQIDALAAALALHPLVHGVRLIGGGFGGSLLALIEDFEIDALLAHLLSEFSAAQGIAPLGWLSVEAGPGAMLCGPGSPPRLLTELFAD